MAAYVKQSAAASGVPVTVSDRQTLLEIARLLVAARAHNAYLPLPANQHRQVGWSNDQNLWMFLGGVT
jgi:hypothetical protein